MTRRLRLSAVMCVLLCVIMTACEDSEEDDNEYWVYELMTQKEKELTYPYSVKVNISGLEAVAYFRNEYELVLKKDLSNNKLEVLASYEYRRDEKLLMRVYGEAWETVGVSLKVKDSDNWHDNWGELFFLQYDTIGFDKASEDPAHYRKYDADRKDVRDFLDNANLKPYVRVVEPVVKSER